jgi:hypothetical protein
VFSSKMLGNSYKMILSGENYTSSLFLDSDAEIGSGGTVKEIASQNVGDYKISLTAKSPAAYYIELSEQKCPDYPFIFI